MNDAKVIDLTKPDFVLKTSVDILKDLTNSVVNHFDNTIEHGIFVITMLTDDDKVVEIRIGSMCGLEDEDFEV